MKLIHPVEWSRVEYHHIIMGASAIITSFLINLLLKETWNIPNLPSLLLSYLFLAIAVKIGYIIVFGILHVSLLRNHKTSRPPGESDYNLMASVIVTSFFANDLFKMIDSWWITVLSVLLVMPIIYKAYEKIRIII